MSETLKQMKSLWKSYASRDPSEVWDAIMEMGKDAIFVADRIAEAMQKDESLSVPQDIMDEINLIAVDGPEDVEEILHATP
jgi:hypothetical protein